MNNIIQKVRQISLSNSYITYILIALHSIIVDYILNSCHLLYTPLFFIILVLTYNLSRSIFKIFVMINSIVAALYFPVYVEYGYMNIHMMISTFYSNPSEALGFLQILNYIMWGVSLLIIIFGIFVAKYKFKKLSKPLLRILLGIFVCLSLFSAVRMVKVYKKKTFVSIVYAGPVRFFHNIYEMSQHIIESEEFIKKLASNTDKWQIKSNEAKKDIQLIVIGESVRRDFMNCYGFKIENTPFMNTCDGIIFNNYISAGGYTVPSLTRTLCIPTDNTFTLEDNIINLANKAGMHTYWISNQGEIGQFDSPIATIAKQSDTCIFIYNDGLNKDNDLIPYVQKAINTASEQTRLIVVHLAGSHPPAKEKTEGKYDYFVKSQEISCYIQSINNTDILLSKIHSMLKQSNHSYSMVYFSDHGLKINGNIKVTHSARYKQNFQVPLFIWADDINERKIINEYRSARDFLLLFEELTGIDTENIRRNYQFISEDKAPEIIITDGNNNNVKYSSLRENIFEID